MALKKYVLFFFLFFLSASAFALEIPAQPTGYVNDYAGALSPQVKQQLEQSLTQFEQTDSTQIVIAIFPSLDGGNIEDISIRLADKWKIGQKGKDNGVILVIFPNDRQLRIEVGYGLEDKLTDAVSSQIIRNEITPQFRNGDFDQGVIAGVNAIEAVVRGVYKGSGQQNSRGKNNSSPLTILIFLFIIGLNIFRSFTRRDRRFGGRGGGFGGFGGFGGGGFGGGSSSGGFGGGGGGGFGGGGSSGRW